MSRKQRFIKHVGKVRIAIIFIAFLTLSLQASEFGKAGKVFGQEGSKQVLNETLKITKSKPVL